MCNKTLTFESNLKKHIASVHEEKKIYKSNDFRSGYDEDHIPEVHDGLKPTYSDFIAVDIGGAGDARAPMEFGGSETGTESEIDNLILSAPPGFENLPMAPDFLSDRKISENFRDEKQKQLNCNKCDKKFTFNIELEKHVAAVHKKKKLLSCRLCDYTSDLSRDLKNHMSSKHGGQKPLKCAICDGDFEVKIKLQKHIESAHGKKVPLDSL